MALDYTGSGTGVFRHLGKLIKHYNLYEEEANDPTTGLDADRKDIFDAFEAGDVEKTLDGLIGAFERWKSEYVDRRAVLARYMLSRIQDRQTVLEQIGATSLDSNEIMYRLIDQMIADSESVLASSVTLGSVVDGADNSGNGKLLTTKTLDGYSSPGSRSGLTYAAHPAYKGIDTELTVPSETMLLECVEDSSDSGGIATFQWRGKIADSNGPYGIENEGSGNIGNVIEAHEVTSSIIENADFEDFTTPNVPDGWTIVSGTAGTHIKSNAVAASVAHGERSLQFTGDGSQATIKVAQVVSADNIETNRQFILSAQVKADASIGAGTLTIQFEGAGYTPGSAEKIEIVAGSLPTAITLQTCFVTMPGSIPSDFKLAIQWTGTPTTSKNLYVDDIAFAPVTYGGGVGVAILRGTIAFAKRDRFSFTVANSEGVFQKAFRQVFGVQLPSVSAGNTIADSLAE